MKSINVQARRLCVLSESLASSKSCIKQIICSALACQICWRLGIKAIFSYSCLQVCTLFELRKIRFRDRKDILTQSPWSEGLGRLEPALWILRARNRLVSWEWRWRVVVKLGSWPVLGLLGAGSGEVGEEEGP